jgi:hypothetical protein
VEHRRDVPLRGERHEEYDGGDVGELWIRSHGAGRRLETEAMSNVRVGRRRSSGAGAWPTNVVCIFKDVAARALARGVGFDSPATCLLDMSLSLSI